MLLVLIKTVKHGYYVCLLLSALFEYFTQNKVAALLRSPSVPLCLQLLSDGAHCKHVRAVMSDNAHIYYLAITGYSLTFSIDRRCCRISNNNGWPGARCYARIVTILNTFRIASVILTQANIFCSRGIGAV